MNSLFALRYKTYMVPVGSLVFMVLLTIFGGYYMFNQIMKVRGDIAKVEEQNNVLEERVNVLRESASVLRAYSDNSVFALPDKNPALAVSSNLRAFAEQEGLRIEELMTSPGFARADDPIQKLGVSMSVVGEKERVFAFLDDISKVAPLINLSQSTILSERGSYTADLEFVAYWSPLPKELPRIDEPLEQLSNEELAVIQQVNALERGEGIRLPEASSTEPRLDPFEF